MVPSKAPEAKSLETSGPTWQLDFENTSEADRDEPLSARFRVGSALSQSMRAFLGGGAFSNILSVFSQRSLLACDVARGH